MSSWRLHTDDGAQAGFNDANCPEDMEFVEHDAAHSVFRSPRPSMTLDELQQQQLRANLLSQDAVNEENKDAVCTKVWGSHSSHTSLESDNDRVKSFDPVVDDINPWKLMNSQMGKCKRLDKRGSHRVCPPVLVVKSDSTEEQNAWEGDTADYQQRVPEETDSDSEEEEDDDAGFELLDYPIIGPSRSKGRY